jgi:hypothetical protein
MQILPRLLVSGFLLLSLAGCAVGHGNLTSSASPVSSMRVSGSVHGGQQPIVGASVALYAAGKTGTASAPRSMLTAPVVSDANGNFSITQLYSCNPGDQVYLVATGGNAGAGLPANPAIALMTAVGPCATLLTTAYTSVNEVTTVASVYALAAFMNGPQALGADYTSAPAANSLAAAFANTQTLVNPASGFSAPLTVGNGQVPYTTVDSLANSLAACINSTPSANGNGSPCNSLFNATTVSGAAPTDTLQATLNLAKNPTLNPAQVFSIASANPPFQPTLTTAPTSYALPVLHPSDILTYHNNNFRTGVQAYETTLTPANVNSASFGKKYTYPVDSYLFAQPLYMGGVGMPDGKLHNVVFAASTHATVYAFDADGAGLLWSVSLIPSGERFALTGDYSSCQNPPEAGIVGTPVIDRATGTLYVVTKTVANIASANITPANTYQRIHALSILDGSERANSPTLINPTFATTSPGSSDGHVGNTIPFNAQTQSNRAALTLTTSSTGSETVWIAYASHCDNGPYHGDVLGYNAANVSQLTASWNNTPNGGDGGIWLGAGGLTADSQGYLYALAGNGTFDANTGGLDYGDSAVKLAAPASGASSTAMTVTDYFTPSEQAEMERYDADLGGAEAIFFNDPASGTAPNLLIASDKNGYIYLINTDNMGRYETGVNGVDSLNGDVMDFPGDGGSFIYNFCFFNNLLYISNGLRSFAYNPGTASTSGYFNTRATAIGSFNGYTAPVVSASGTANAIVWTEDDHGILRALNPDLTELYNSTQAANNRDTAPTLVKFTSPIIANGNVYLSGQGSLAIYGLLP